LPLQALPIRQPLTQSHMVLDMARVDKEQLEIAESHPWRVLPSVKDGLIPPQRKVLHTLLQQKLRKEIKVSELAGKVALLYTDEPDQHEIEQGIIKLAQTFVGANNINYLEPNGWFGSRREGGKDAAEGRYIYTKLSAMTRFVFPEGDESHLARRIRKGKQGEPRTYEPVLPMILVNGYQASGPDWQTQIPPYNPRDIIENLRRRMRGTSKNDMRSMQPWFRDWTGQVEELDRTHHTLAGKILKTSENVMEVTELPPRLWTKDFRSELNKHMSGPSPRFKSYTEHPAITGVRFVIELNDCSMDGAYPKDLEADLHLHKTIATNNLVAMDAAGQIQKYATELDILEDFYVFKLRSFSWKKTRQLLAMRQDLKRWEDQSRFAELLLGGDLDISQDRDTLVNTLIRLDFSPVENYDDIVIPTRKRKRNVDVSHAVPGYEHLFEMTVSSMMPGPMQELCLLIAKKKADMVELERKPIKDMWEADLQMIEEEWDRQLEYDRTHPRESSCKRCGGLGCSTPDDIRSR
jgi:DNA topoisomerase-2